MTTQLAHALTSYNPPPQPFPIGNCIITNIPKPISYFTALPHQRHMSLISRDSNPYKPPSPPWRPHHAYASSSRTQTVPSSTPSQCLGQTYCKSLYQIYIVQCLKLRDAWANISSI